MLRDDGVHQAHPRLAIDAVDQGAAARLAPQPPGRPDVLEQRGLLHSLKPPRIGRTCTFFALVRCPFL